MNWNVLLPIAMKIYLKLLILTKAMQGIQFALQILLLETCRTLTTLWILGNLKASKQKNGGNLNPPQKFLQLYLILKYPHFTALKHGL
jgi:hypothetical protein